MNKVTVADGYFPVLPPSLALRFACISLVSVLLPFGPLVTPLLADTLWKAWTQEFTKLKCPQNSETLPIDVFFEWH